MTRYGIIYMARSKITEKSYIGQTIGSLESRINGHYQDSKRRDYKFHRALKKYNKENWIWIILYSNIPAEQLNNIEKWCIANYNTYTNGYNSTEGGDINPMYGKIHSKKTKEKISKTSKGKKLSDEHKNKMSNVKCKYTYEITTPNNTIEITKNLKKYCKENNLNCGAMSDVVNGKRKHHKNYIVERLSL